MKKGKKEEVVGVRLKEVGEIYIFLSTKDEMRLNEYVVVETPRGIELGYIVKEKHTIKQKKEQGELKTIIRKATKEDLLVKKTNEKDVIQAKKICELKIKSHNLDMKLIDIEYTFDRSKLLFYFTAEGRIDFRNLVKDLARIFKTRIELRQVGVRDEAKILNGIGICGRTLCCATFLTSFEVVSLKMAKDQRISLNPNKISGCCGRLMCCLKYEEKAYEELNKNCINIGDIVKCSEGRAEVSYVSHLKQEVDVIVRKKEEVIKLQLKISDITLISRNKKNDKDKEKEDSKELKDLLDD